MAPTDDHGNIFPSKKRSRGRIDPVMAALNARKLSTSTAAAPPPYQMVVFG
jgi:phage terminase large subunit-like protein